MINQMYKDIFPDVIRVESSALCNFNCLHCSNGQSHPNNRGIMSIELFDLLMEQFKNKRFVPRVLVLYHVGEPLINPNIYSFIKKAKDYNVEKIKIVTNGSLLTMEKSKKLIEAGLTDMDVSFDGISAFENDSIRINGNFERDALNIIEFLKINKGKVNVCISNVSLANKGGEYSTPPKYLFDKFKDYANQIKFITVPAMVWPGFDIKSSPFKVINKQYNSNICYCPQLFETISILANGDVVPCCYDIIGKEIFGNITKNDIFEIWDSNKMTLFRKNIREGNINSFCKDCSLYCTQQLVWDNQKKGEKNGV